MKYWTLILMLCFSTVTFAQHTGEIAGVVIDEGGRPVSSVVITAESPDLEGSRTQVSSGNGRFSFRMLPPGDYTLTAALAGLRTTQVAVRVGPNKAARPTITMYPLFPTR